MRKKALRAVTGHFEMSISPFPNGKYGAVMISIMSLLEYYIYRKLDIVYVFKMLYVSCHTLIVKGNIF